MSKIRRVFSKEFKAKVVLEVLKEKNNIEVLAKKQKNHLNLRFYLNG